MPAVNKSFKLSTKGNNDIIDITGKVEDVVASSKISNGIVTVFVSGSTVGITTIEYETGLISDMKTYMEKLFPRAAHYEHNATWGDGNGYAHVRAAFTKSFFTVPIVNGELTLGTWQQIVLLDFDNRSRTREIIVQIVGEA